MYNRDLDYALVSVIVSFCHLLLRHVYLKDASMRCLTIMKAFNEAFLQIRINAVIHEVSSTAYRFLIATRLEIRI